MTQGWNASCYYPYPMVITDVSDLKEAAGIRVVRLTSRTMSKCCGFPELHYLPGFDAMGNKLRDQACLLSMADQGSLHEYLQMTTLHAKARRVIAAREVSCVKLSAPRPRLADRQRLPGTLNPNPSRWALNVNCPTLKRLFIQQLGRDLKMEPAQSEWLLRVRQQAVLSGI